MLKLLVCYNVQGASNRHILKLLARSTKQLFLWVILEPNHTSGERDADLDFTRLEASFFSWCLGCGKPSAASSRSGGL